MTQVERYAFSHLLRLEQQERHPFLIHIAKNLGVTDSDLSHFHTFAHRMMEMTTLAHERNCVFYVDAEQTYMQRAIDSIAGQLSQRFNRDDRTIIMNGYQNYLKRVAKTLPLEI